MSGVGDEDPGALRFTPLVEVIAHHQHASHLALGTGCRLERYASKACDLLKPFLERVHQKHRTLNRFGILVRVQPSETWQPGHLLVDFGVVLHRAGAQWVEALVNAVVHLGQAQVMSHDVNLADLRQRQIVAQQLLGGHVCLGHITIGQNHAAAAGGGQVVDQRFGHPPTSSRAATRSSISTWVLVSVTATSM